MNLTAVFRIRDQGSSRLRRITQMMDRMNRTTRSATQSSNLYRDANGRLHDSMGRFVSETSRATNATSSLATRVNGLRVGTNGLSASLGGTQTALLGIASAFLTASGLASGFSNFTQAADSYSNINARLANINDGLQTQSQLQDKIFKASRRSRSSYDEMASSVAKLNLLAKDAFSSNDEAIRFTELMTKSFSVSGAGQQEMESGMYQLTQAMASGKLQGDEFRSIMENAPLLAQAISNTAGVSMGALKEMSSEGTITADLIKRSLFNAADEIEEKFGNMPMTFSQAVTVFKSSAKRVFEPLFDQFIGFVNSKTFEKLENKAHSFVKIAANGLSKVFSIVKSLYQVWQTIGPSVIKVAKVIGTFALVAGSILAVVGIVKLVGMALAFLASPIGLIAAGITGLIFGFKALYDNSKTFRSIITGIGSAFKAVSTIFKSGFKGYGSARNILEEAGFNEGQVRLVIKFAYSLKGAFDKVRGSFQAVSHIFSGEYRAARDLLKAVGLDETQVKSVIKFSYILKGAVDKVKSVFKELTTAFNEGGIGGVFDKVFGEGSFETIKTKFEEFRAYATEKFGQLKGVFGRLKETFSQAFSTIADIISNVWSIIEPYLSGFWNILQVIGDIAMIVFNNVIAPAISFLVQLFSTLWAVAKPILELLGIAWEALSTIIKWGWDNVLAPLVDFILTGVKNALDNFSGALSIVQGWFETLSGWISTAKGHVKDFIGFISNVKLPSWISNGISAGVNFVGNLMGAGDGKNKSAKSHYHGISNVPYDSYYSRLHKGERVLTAQENKDYSEGNSGGITIAKLADSIVIREEADIDKFAYKLAKLIEKERVQVG